jgi:hypothetical protein
VEAVVARVWKTRISTATGFSDGIAADPREAHSIQN